MPQEYAPIDDLAAKSVQIRFYLSPKTMSDPNFESGPLAEFVGKDLPLQFVPAVEDTYKGANWNESGNAAAYEPIRTWGGAQAKRIRIKLVYIIDGNKWTADYISKIVHFAFSYFYTTLAEQAADKQWGPYIEIRNLYGHVQQRSTWVMDNLSLAPSTSLVLDSLTAADTGVRFPGTSISVPSILGGIGANSSLPASQAPASNFRETAGFHSLVSTLSLSLASYTKVGSSGNPQGFIGNSDINVYPESLWY